MKDCHKCVHMKLCYDTCDSSYDTADCNCLSCSLPTCPEYPECEYYLTAEDVVRELGVKMCATDICVGSKEE